MSKQDKPRGTDARYGEQIDIEVNDEIYKIQCVEFEDEAFFFTRKSDEVVCMIFQDEKGNWDSDADIDKELLTGFVKWINKLYLK